jgi:hypothetical protein
LLVHEVSDKSFFLFLGSPGSSESSCSLFWLCFVVETTYEFLSPPKPPQLQLQWLTTCCIACSFLALSSFGMCTRRRVFSSCSVMLRRSSAGPSSSSCVLAPLTKEEIPLACLNKLRFLRASCSVSLFQAFKGHYSDEETLLWKLSGFQSLRPDCEARR